MSAEVLRGASLVAARARILSTFGLLPTEAVPLAQSLGRILAEPLLARRDQPPFDASAMDGWAVSAGKGPFAVVGESAAGAGWAGRLESGQAVRIFTGAAVPPGAERVVIQEVARLEPEGLGVPPPGDAPRYIRSRGGDFRAGDVLLEAGATLDPWRLVLAAAAGADRLSVARRPRISVLPTGTELAPPGAEPGSWQVFESAGPGLCALIQTWGGLSYLLPPASDDADEIVSAAQGLEADLIVVIGGASVGDHDLVKPALARLGLGLAVDTVNLRPGKPLWFGRLESGLPVLGLPGNPASALVCAELFLAGILARMTGRDTALGLEPGLAGAPLAANGSREHWMRAKVALREDGARLVIPFDDQDSSLVAVFAGADALLMRPAGAAAVPAGTSVEILPLLRP